MKKIIASVLVSIFLFTGICFAGEKEELQLKIENLNMQLTILQQRYELVSKIELPELTNKMNKILAEEKKAKEAEKEVKDK